MGEADGATPCPGPPGPIDEATPSFGDLGESAVHARDSKRHVVDSRAPRREELGDGRLGVERLEQLDVGTADGDERDPYSVRRNLLGCRVGGAHERTPPLDRLGEVLHGDADVVEFRHLAP
jgi:hypothetical protein